MLLASEAAFNTQVLPASEKPIASAVWYQVFDGRPRAHRRCASVCSTASPRSRRVSRRLLNKTTLDASPVAALKTYSEAARTLTLLLTIFSVPVLLLVLFFIGQIAAMVVQRGQGEIALLRSRGTTRAQVLFIHLLGRCVDRRAGLDHRVDGGQRVGAMDGPHAHLPRSDVDQRPSAADRLFADGGVVRRDRRGAGDRGDVDPGAVGFTPHDRHLPLVAGAHRCASLRGSVTTSMGCCSSRRSTVGICCASRAAWRWRGRAAISFSNPLLFLVPALFCFSLALLFMRLFPLVMRACAWLADRLPGITALLTLRQVARSTGQYAGPLLLLTITLSLATFSASMAATLDGHLRDQAYYQVGADVNLAELGEDTTEQQQATLPGQQPVPQPRKEDEPRWLFVPVSDHLRVPGVQGGGARGRLFGDEQHRRAAADRSVVGDRSGGVSRRRVLPHATSPIVKHWAA